MAWVAGADVGADVGAVMGAVMGAAAGMASGGLWATMGMLGVVRVVWAKAMVFEPKDKQARIKAKSCFMNRPKIKSIGIFAL